MKLKTKEVIQVELLETMLGDEYYIHTMDADKTPQFFCFFMKDGEVAEGFKEECEKIDSRYDMNYFYTMNHLLAKTPNHNKTDFCLIINYLSCSFKFGFYDENDYYEYSYYIKDAYNFIKDSYIIVVEPSRNTNPYIFILGKDLVDGEITASNIKNIIMYCFNDGENLKYDSRNDNITIVHQRTDLNKYNKIDNPLSRVEDSLKLAAEDLSKITLNDNGDVVSYITDGMCFERTYNDSDYEIDFEDLIYYKDKKNVIRKKHVYGNHFRINIVILGESKDTYISNDDAFICDTKNYTHEIMSLGNKIVRTYKDDRLINEEKAIEFDCPEAYSETNVVDGKTVISAVDGTKITLSVGKLPDKYHFSYTNADGEEFGTSTFDANTNGSLTKFGTSIIDIKDGIIASKIGKIYSSSQTDASGKILLYKDSFQEIQFDFEGNIFDYKSDIFDCEDGSYYIRDSYGIPYKYSPKKLGIYM